MKLLIPIIITFSFLFTENISEIEIHGNKVTHDYIILREIIHPLNTEFSDSLRIEDQNRLYNLGIFSFVQIKKVNNIYQINVKEAFRFYPLPLIDIDESKGSEGTSYGLALSILNLNGKNRRFEVGSMFGNKHVYFLRFSDPWIIGDHVSFVMDLFQKNEQSFWYDNKIENVFNNIMNGLEFGTGFYLGLKNKFNIKVGLFKNSIDFKEYDATGLVQEYQNYGMSFTYSYDSRNIFIDPTKGNLFKINLNQNLGINGSKSFSNLYLEWNQYFKILEFKELTLNIKSKLLLQDSKHIPIFNYYSLGSEDFVRGYNPYPSKNKLEIQGEIRTSQIYSQSLEFQYTLIEKKSYDGFEFGLDNLLFLDIGFGNESIDELFNNIPLIGYGVGFRFFMSGMGTIGVDFGFNPYSLTPQLHLSDGKDN